MLRREVRKGKGKVKEREGEGGRRGRVGWLAPFMEGVFFRVRCATVGHNGRWNGKAL